MNGKGHRAVGLAAYIVAAPFMPLHGPSELAAGAVVAVATSSGKLFSPDADQGWLWRLADKLIPDEEILDDNGPMQHRGVTHWFVWPLLLWAASLIPWDVWVSVNGHALRIASGWLLASMAVGIGSHVFADFIVGAAGQGRSAGVPIFPWWGHVGLGFECGGVVESVLTRAVIPLALAAALWLHFGDLPAGVAGLPVVAVAGWWP